MNEHKVIAVDFDGVLCEECWPEIGEEIANAGYALRAIKAAGHTIIIDTCREGDLATAAQEWMAEREMPFDYWNENAPERIARYGADCRKIGSDLRVDDRMVGGFPGWLAVLAELGIVSVPDSEEDWQ